MGQQNFKRRHNDRARDSRPSRPVQKTAEQGRPSRGDMRAQHFDDFELVIGRNAVREAINHCPERIVRVMYAQGRGESDDVGQQLLGLLKRKRIEVQNVAQATDLTRIAHSDSHQSFIALLRRDEGLGLKEFIQAMEQKPSALVVALDEIHDPQNVGSIFRASECFGADALLWSRNRGADVTASVSKASVGASILVPRLVVSNLVDALGKLSDAGFWVVGADASSQAENLQEFAFPEKTVLVLGSEGEGLRDLVQKNLNFKVKIPMLGKIDSLNVAQAASVFLYAYRARMNSAIDKTSNLK